MFKLNLSCSYANTRRYNPSVRLRFVTDSLGFEADEEAAQFVLDHAGQELLEEKGETMFVKTRNRVFEDLKVNAFSNVDIKGQI